MTTKKNDIFGKLRNRAKDRTSFKTFVMEDEEIGELKFRLRPVTMDEILHASDVIPSYFSGISGQSGSIEELDDEEKTEAVLRNLEVSRIVVCLAVELEGDTEGQYLTIVDKTADECAEDEMPVEAFDNNQIAELAAEVMGRIRFR